MTRLFRAVLQRRSPGCGQLARRVLLGALLSASLQEVLCQPVPASLSDWLTAVKPQVHYKVSHCMQGATAVPARNRTLDLQRLAARLSLPADLVRRSIPYTMDLGGHGIARIVLMAHPEDIVTRAVVGREVKEDRYRLLEHNGIEGDVLDIGAHGGAVAILLALLHPRARIHAFEPSSVNFFYLVWNLYLNGVAGRVIPRHLGLSADGGRREFLLSTRDSTGSRLRTWMRTTEKATRTHVMRAKSVRVDTIRLDDFLRRCVANNGSVALVKLDCEGCEYEVVPQNAEFFVNVGRIVGEMHAHAGGGQIQSNAAYTREILCESRPQVAIARSEGRISSTGEAPVPGTRDYIAHCSAENDALMRVNAESGRRKQWQAPPTQRASARCVGAGCNGANSVHKAEHVAMPSTDRWWIGMIKVGGLPEELVTILQIAGGCLALLCCALCWFGPLDEENLPKELVSREDGRARR